ncbi:Homoaconitase [Hortaea werneckii]|nr:Homoaconitase [Hortaea werneckii]
MLASPGPYATRTVNPTPLFNTRWGAASSETSPSSSSAQGSSQNHDQQSGSATSQLESEKTEASTTTSAEELVAETPSSLLNLHASHTSDAPLPAVLSSAQPGSWNEDFIAATTSASLPTHEPESTGPSAQTGLDSKTAQGPEIAFGTSKPGNALSVLSAAYESYLSTETSAALPVVVTSSLPMEASMTQSTVLNFGSTPLTLFDPTPGGAITVGTSTVQPGGQVTLDQQTISYGSSGLEVVHDSSTSTYTFDPIPASSKQLGEDQDGGETFTVGSMTVYKPEGTELVVVDGTTLSVDGSALSVDGKELSLAPSGLAVASGSDTELLPFTAADRPTSSVRLEVATLTIASSTITATRLAPTAVVIGESHTLQVGGPAYTADDEIVLTLGPEGLIAANGDQTSTMLATSKPSPPSSHQTVIIASGQTWTAAPLSKNDGSQGVSIGDTTLFQDGPALTLSGKVLTAASDGRLVVQDSSMTTTVRLPALVSQGGATASTTPDSGAESDAEEGQSTSKVPSGSETTTTTPSSTQSVRGTALSISADCSISFPLSLSPGHVKRISFHVRMTMICRSPLTLNNNKPGPSPPRQIQAFEQWWKGRLKDALTIGKKRMKQNAHTRHYAMQFFPSPPPPSTRRFGMAIISWTLGGSSPTDWRHSGPPSPSRTMTSERRTSQVKVQPVRTVSCCCGGGCRWGAAEVVVAAEGDEEEEGEKAVRRRWIRAPSRPARDVAGAGDLGEGRVVVLHRHRGHLGRIGGEGVVVGVFAGVDGVGVDVVGVAPDDLAGDFFGEAGEDVGEGGSAVDTPPLSLDSPVSRSSPSSTAASASLTSLSNASSIVIILSSSGIPSPSPLLTPVQPSGVCYDLGTSQVSLGICASHSTLEIPVRSGNAHLAWLEESSAEADTGTAARRKWLGASFEQGLPVTLFLGSLLFRKGSSGNIELDAVGDPWDLAFRVCSGSILEDLGGGGDVAPTALREGSSNFDAIGAGDGLPNSSSNRSWLKRSVVLLAVSEGDVYMLASVALYRSHPLSTSSIGNSPERAPHSVVMLAIASRSSTGNERIVVVSPVNSIAWFKTSSLLNKPHRATITSLPVTPSGRIPVKLTRAIGGICHHVRPVAQIEAASVRTTGVPKQATPPFFSVLFWTSWSNVMTIWLALWIFEAPMDMNLVATGQELSWAMTIALDNLLGQGLRSGGRRLFSGKELGGSGGKLGGKGV